MDFLEINSSQPRIYRVYNIRTIFLCFKSDRLRIKRAQYSMLTLASCAFALSSANFCINCSLAFCSCASSIYRCLFACSRAHCNRHCSAFCSCLHSSSSRFSRQLSPWCCASYASFSRWKSCCCRLKTSASSCAIRCFSASAALSASSCCWTSA